MDKELLNYHKKREILSKKLKLSHFNNVILDKSENFSRQNLYQKACRNIKFYLIFKTQKMIVREKCYEGQYRGRIPIGIHKSARVKNQIAPSHRVKPYLK